MKTIISILVVCALFSCKKDASHCYECQMSNNSTYTDVGCYNADEWKNIQFSDPNSNNIDKKTKCRIK